MSKRPMELRGPPKFNFPQTLYVVIENEGTNDEFMTAHAAWEKIETPDGRRVIAAYELVDEQVLSRTASLTPKLKG